MLPRVNLTLCSWGLLVVQHLHACESLFLIKNSLWEDGYSCLRLDIIAIRSLDCRSPFHQAPHCCDLHMILHVITKTPPLLQFLSILPKQKVELISNSGVYIKVSDLKAIEQTPKESPTALMRSLISIWYSGRLLASCSATKGINPDIKNTVFGEPMHTVIHYACICPPNWDHF